MVPGLVAPVALTGSDEKSKSSHQTSSTLTVFHHSLITTTIDQLRFDAAASLQLRPKQASLSTAKMGHELIASPYNEPGNLLDLRRLPLQEQLLAKAFTIFRPTRDDYAQAKYEESFNYQATIDALRVLAAEEGHVWKSQAYHIVYFRSELREDADRHLLAEADNLAHGEAMESGGLLKYWFGKAGDDGKNLATCIWQSKEHAIQGGRGPWHQRAKALVNQYKWMDFHRSWLWIGDSASEWEIISSEESEKAGLAVKMAIARA